jgi:hypothetical protein
VYLLLSFVISCNFVTCFPLVADFNGGLSLFQSRPHYVSLLSPSQPPSDTAVAYNI